MIPFLVPERHDKEQRVEFVAQFKLSQREIELGRCEEERIVRLSSNVIDRDHVQSLGMSSRQFRILEYRQTVLALRRLVAHGYLE